MTIERRYLECLTCNADITARVSLGNDVRQEHTFICPTCKEEIKFAISIDFQNIRTSIEHIVNCRQGEKEGFIVNLSPNYPIAKEFANSDLYFSDMQESRYLREITGIGKKLEEQTKNIKGPIYVSSYELLGGTFNPITRWSKVKKMWSLYTNKQIVLLDRLIPNKDYFQNPVTHKKDFSMVLLDFTSRFTQNLSKIDPIMQYSTNAMQNHINEYLEFLDFFYSELFENSLKAFYNLFVEFFDNHNEYEQVAIYSLQNTHIPDTHDVSSFNFAKTKMFYGNAYEIFTENINILAILYNVANGRAYSAFEKMDYKTYMGTDKANRCNPFKDIPELYSICEILDSSLRNSSHHVKIDFDVQKNLIIYTSGKNKIEKEITYANYLKKCYDIIRSISVLLSIIILHRNRYMTIYRDKFI